MVAATTATANTTKLLKRGDGGVDDDSTAYFRGCGDGDGGVPAAFAAETQRRGGGATAEWARARRDGVTGGESNGATTG